MRLPVRRALSIGAIAVALGGLTTTGANAAPDAATSVADCHSNAYEVQDSNGNLVTAITYAYDYSGAYAGFVWVELWYCPDYQSNFARAYWFPSSPSASPDNVEIEVVGQWHGPNGPYAYHELNPNAENQDGSQDSPAYYAPVEPAEACAEPYWPYEGAYVCTEFV